MGFKSAQVRWWGRPKTSDGEIAILLGAPNSLTRSRGDFVRNVRRLDFEALEGRALLTRSFLSIPETAPRLIHAEALPVPLSITGTVDVDLKAVRNYTNYDGSFTASIPVLGHLGSLGRIKGVWTETEGAYGGFQGSSTILFHNAHGTFVIAFNNGATNDVEQTPSGTVYSNIAQRFNGGTGRYAHAAENGTISLVTNPGGNGIASMELVTTDPPLAPINPGGVEIPGRQA